MTVHLFRRIKLKSDKDRIKWKIGHPKTVKGTRIVRREIYVAGYVKAACMG